MKIEDAPEEIGSKVMSLEFAVQSGMAITTLTLVVIVITTTTEKNTRRGEFNISGVDN